jgi:hypothetical protein
VLVVGELGAAPWAQHLVGQKPLPRLLDHRLVGGRLLGRRGLDARGLLGRSLFAATPREKRNGQDQRKLAGPAPPRQGGSGQSRKLGQVVWGKSPG